MQVYLFFGIILIPIVGGAILPLFRFRSSRARGMYTLLVCLACSAHTVALLLLRRDESLVLYSIMDGLDIVFRCDSLSCVFAGLLAFLWPLASLYGLEYMEHESGPDRFFAFYTMSLGIAMAIALSGNLFTLYMFYECLTLFTLPLVSHRKDEASIRAARRYVTFSITGAAMAFVGLIFLIHYGDISLFRLGGVLDAESIAGRETLLQWVFFTALIGFGTKAALFPLHAWLPAVSVAPTPVTALLHAVAVVNAGTFAVTRLIYYCFGSAFLAGSPAQTAALCVTCLTVLLGAVQAIREPHFKRRLAWSTVSNLSYMLTGLCLMSPGGMAGGLAHLVCHSLMKITMFWCCGAFMVRTGIEEVRDLRGLGRIMPRTCAFLALGAIALTGIPPLCGFVSKWEILMAAEDTGTFMGHVASAVIITASLATAVYALSTILPLYFRPLNERWKHLDGQRLDPGWRMLLPLGIVACVIIALGVWSRPLITFLRQTGAGTGF